MKQIIIPPPPSHYEEDFVALLRAAIGRGGRAEDGLYDKFGKKGFREGSQFLRIVSRKPNQAVSQLIRENIQGHWENGTIWHLPPAAIALRGKKLPLIAFPACLETDPQEFPVLSNDGYARQLATWNMSKVLDHPEAYFLFVQRA